MIRLVELRSLQGWKRLDDGRSFVVGSSVAAPVRVGDRFTIAGRTNGTLVDIDAVVEAMEQPRGRAALEIGNVHGAGFSLRGPSPGGGDLATMSGIVADEDDPAIEPLSVAADRDRFWLVVSMPLRLPEGLRVIGRSGGRLRPGDRLLVPRTGQVVRWTLIDSIRSGGLGDTTGLLLDTDADAESLRGATLVGLRVLDG